MKNPNEKSIYASPGTRKSWPDASSPKVGILRDTRPTKYTWVYKKPLSLKIYVCLWLSYVISQIALTKFKQLNSRLFHPRAYIMAILTEMKFYTYTLKLLWWKRLYWSQGKCLTLMTTCSWIFWKICWNGRSRWQTFLGLKTASSSKKKQIRFPFPPKATCTVVLIL